MIRLATLLSAAAALALMAGPSLARPRPRHTTVAPAQQPSAPHTFYPEHVEGGVTGNYTFNNQIRKHTDPLNANGGK